jgi:Uncharacterized protein conserved in bacteria
MMKQLDLFEVEDDFASGAHFSMAGSYRYSLWRIWDSDKPKIMFIGLNPSTADKKRDDPTIRRVISFAKQWGYGGIFMLNLFTIITSDPRALRNCPDRDRKADEFLQIYDYLVQRVVFAWGNFKESKERSQEVIRMFPNAYCLKKNKDGSPRHPLYVKDGTELIKF